METRVIFPRLFKLKNEELDRYNISDTKINQKGSPIRKVVFNDFSMAFLNGNINN